MKAGIVVRVQSLHRHRSQSDRDICHHHLHDGDGDDHDHLQDGDGEIHRRVLWLGFLTKPMQILMMTYK